MLSEESTLHSRFYVYVGFVNWTEKNWTHHPQGSLVINPSSVFFHHLLLLFSVVVDSLSAYARFSPQRFQWRGLLLLPNCFCFHTLTHIKLPLPSVLPLCTVCVIHTLSAHYSGGMESSSLSTSLVIGQITSSIYTCAACCCGTECVGGSKTLACADVFWVLAHTFLMKYASESTLSQFEGSFNKGGFIIRKHGVYHILISDVLSTGYLTCVSFYFTLLCCWERLAQGHTW